MPGPEIDDQTDELLRLGLGGIVLFSHNLLDVPQAAQLISDLRARAAGPLRIAVDQEGGQVTRMAPPLTHFPGAMAIAATGSTRLAYEVARATGRELAALGVDVDLAPVLDVAADLRNPTIGTRSFGSSPASVARYGAAQIRGLRDAGVLPTAKHFPGHGRTPVDSHVDLPRVRGERPILDAIDLPPFRRAVDVGVPIVMTGHVVYTGLSDGRPATLSRRVIRSLLRRELGFRGLVVTDALVMDSIADRLPVGEAAVQAVEAGADAVMTLGHEREVVGALAAAIRSGRLSQARVAEARGRAEVLELLTSRPPAPADAGPRITALGPAHRALAAEVASRGLVSVAGASHARILRTDRALVVEFAGAVSSPVHEGRRVGSELSVALGRSVTAVRGRIVPPAVNAAETSRLIAEAARADVTVLATRDAYLSREQAALVDALASAARRCILVALRNPIDVALLGPTNGSICTFGDDPATIAALADALVGTSPLTGRLAVYLPRRAEVRRPAA